MVRILIVEDDAQINGMLAKLLRKNGYETVSAYSGTEAILQLRQETFQLILLDLMLPGQSGEAVLTQVREQYAVPVICVSAKDDVRVRVAMIKNGADDYLVKPFHNEELLARIEAVLRRNQSGSGSQTGGCGGPGKVYRFEKLELDCETRRVSLDGRWIELTPREYGILELLMANPRKVFTKQNIFESVWAEESVADDERTVTTHVANLRKKLQEGESYIQTVWGIGYKMRES